MKRTVTTLVIFAACSVVVRADVTIVQTTTIEGGMTAMGAQTPSPTMTYRVKGLKQRADVDAQIVQVSTIADLEARQVIVLRPDQKTAQIITPGIPTGAPPPPAALPSIDSSFNPTGKSQVIDGFKCDEYTFSMSMSMAEMNPGGAMPPEAVEMMKGLRLRAQGSMWIARDVPGAADYIAFQKAAGASGFDSLLATAAGTGMNVPGMDRIMKAIGSLNGLAYLTEMTMTAQGTGQMAEMMQQFGAMKITTRVTSISTDPIADEAFRIPPGYTVVKQ